MRGIVRSMRSMPIVAKKAVPSQEGCAGGGFLVAVGFAVGQPGAVVGGGVDVVEAGGVFAVPAAGGRPWMCQPPSGIRASFLASRWTGAPGFSRSWRRMLGPWAGPTRLNGSIAGSEAVVACQRWTVRRNQKKGHDHVGRTSPTRHTSPICRICHVA